MLKKMYWIIFAKSENMEQNPDLFSFWWKFLEIRTPITGYNNQPSEVDVFFADNEFFSLIRQQKSTLIDFLSYFGGTLGNCYNFSKKKPLYSICFQGFSQVSQFWLSWSWASTLSSTRWSKSSSTSHKLHQQSLKKALNSINRRDICSTSWRNRHFTDSITLHSRTFTWSNDFSGCQLLWYHWSSVDFCYRTYMTALWMRRWSWLLMATWTMSKM